MKTKYAIYVDPYRLPRYPTAGNPDTTYPTEFSSFRIPYDTIALLNNKQKGCYLLFCDGNLQFVGGSSDLHVSISTMARKYYFDQVAILEEGQIIPESFFFIYGKFGGKKKEVREIISNAIYQLLDLGYFTHEIKLKLKL